MELASQRIGVSLVEPGAVKSEIWRKGLVDTAAIDRGDAAGARYAGLIAGVEEIVRHAERSAIPASRTSRRQRSCERNSRHAVAPFSSSCFGQAGFRSRQQTVNS